MDTWDRGDAYEAYIGRWSRQVARELVAWLSVPPGGRWIDVGCGTGALTRAILDAGAAEVLAVDASAAYLADARRTLGDERVRFERADARALPGADGAFDAAVSGLVLNFVPEPAALPTRADGSIELIARAWAVRGTRA